MKKRKLNIKKTGITSIAIIGICLIGLFVFQQVTQKEDTTTNTPTPSPTNEFSGLSYYHQDNLERYKNYKKLHNDLSIEDIVTHVNMSIDKEFYSGDPIYVDNPEDLTVLVNKYYKLPDDFAPTDLVVVDDYKGQSLRQVAATAFINFREACNKQGFTIYAHSGYRSTAFQQQIYDNMINTYGQEYTDNYVSRPGQSEHTTGLSVDISIDGIPYEEITDSKYYSWFYEHLADYGFILRYPDGKEDLTGYHYESWHIRYVGVDLAKKVLASGLTYDEYVARQ